MPFDLLASTRSADPTGAALEGDVRASGARRGGQVLVASRAAAAGNRGVGDAGDRGDYDAR